ncbi:unnamed protein product [Spirodela intermedia]|uniref:Uncharacterized protein n=1 Tax=Spirodela intermedia TaxID=51605 RepID=A0A7I8LKJ9_SPIIN|nr:unnamed protein product [Spirodela intermedia]
MAIPVTPRRKRSSLHRAALVLVVALVAAALLVEVAEGSTFIAYGGPGCTGTEQRFSACGVCHRINQHGGYRLVYTGQPAAIFSSAECLSEPGLLPAESFSSCFPFSGDAVVIRCD